MTKMTVAEKVASCVEAAHDATRALIEYRQVGLSRHALEAKKFRHEAMRQARYWKAQAV